MSGVNVDRDPDRDRHQDGPRTGIGTGIRVHDPPQHQAASSPHRSCAAESDASPQLIEAADVWL